MPDLRTGGRSNDEIDGLDESADGVPVPNTASGFAADFSLPTVVPRRAHPLAILALVLAFIVPIVAIPLAHRITRKLQHEGGRGRALAHAAIIIGYLNILVIALVVLNVAVAGLLHTGL
ncbi:DUF4190 domain-containing protein [Leifsonia sp. SIMBA_070]|uniref:DUF4190 domain-containing protein n=1 Tax=Leifsonia sp. SIMBA_070 TaxID=3085810 RepID=UPI003977F3EB